MEKSKQMNFFETFSGNLSEFNDLFQKTKVVHVLPNKMDLSADAYFRKLSAECGIPLIHDEEPATGKLVIDRWSIIEYNPEKCGTYKYSNTAQSLHIDYSYFSFDIYAAFIFCEKQAEFGGATRFIDVDTIVQILEVVDRTLLDQLQNTIIQFGREGNPIANKKDYILSKDDLGWRINWNYFRAKDDIANLKLVESFKLFLDSNIEQSGELKELKLKPGEGVFFHDKRVLHGRNSFIGNRLLNKAGIVTIMPEIVKKLIAEGRPNYA